MCQIVAALSTVLSTAALDKHPQSRERGITLDLGFSSFTLPATPEAREAGYEGIQFTLVDCPGHASLIRTVVGGAQIMNAMLLVVDVTKGIQTQTAECIVIGEITTDRMIVVLNKIGMMSMEPALWLPLPLSYNNFFPDLPVDQLDPEKRERHTKKAKKLVAETLAATKFAGCPILAVAARPGAGDGGAHTNAAGPMGIDELRAALLSCVSLEAPPLSSSFLFYIDHCFAVKGQGTVLTGTVSSGRVAVGDTIELPALKLQRKVKSMQMFRRPVNAAQRGDRVGICVTQLDASSIERGLACSPGVGMQQQNEANETCMHEITSYCANRSPYSRTSSPNCRNGADLFRCHSVC